MSATASCTVRTIARRLTLGLVVVVAASTAAACATAHAEGAVRWRSAPALPPPPPEGVEAGPYPVPVGEVGELSFWEPNRGLLITGGAGPVSSGLYAYDGSSWHQLSTVCGGAEGRIAWAGPDDFWTISDQRPGQALGGKSDEHPSDLHSLSLCHFVDGQVVGSYAKPLEESESYVKMNAAACYGPSDCWFAGGAFHLHWNGSTLTAIEEPGDTAVTDMTMFGGQLYESEQIEGGGARHPALIHEIAPEGQTFACGEVESPFCDVVMSDEGVPLPEYGNGVSPEALQGLDLATDSPPLGAGATQLWAAGDPRQSFSPGASLTVLHGVLEANGELKWSQISSRTLEQTLGGDGLEGSPTVFAGDTEDGVEEAIAPEPGSTSAWLSLPGPEVVRLDSEGTLSEPDEPVSLPEPGEHIGNRGEAGPIVCPAEHDCWLATTDESGPTPGWLFHYSDGEPIAPDTDQFFDGADGVITYRPPDSGVPVVYPDLPPEDDSLINQQPEPTQSSAQDTRTGASPTRVTGKPLLEHVKSSLVHAHTLVISFTLTASAHVRLVGRRKHRIVASTPSEVLRPGRRKLSLRLDPRAWPTSIKFDATPIGASSPQPESSSSGVTQAPIAADTVET